MPKILRCLAVVTPRHIVVLAVLAIAGAAHLPFISAQAQLLNQLKDAAGVGEGGSTLGALGGGAPSVNQASPSNLTGVLQYCIQNKYLGGNNASSVKDSMLGKLNGAGQGANDSRYKSGNSGLLETGNGQNFSLGGDGLKAQVTQKVCDLVLQHAKSML